MKKLFSLVAMMFCVISGWAQKAPETPIYFQIPASPYVVDLTEVNCKVGNTQTWIAKEEGAWTTVAPGTTGWHGKWTNMDTNEPVFAPYDDPTWTAPSADYGFEGQAVRDNGTSLYMYVRNITSVTGFFVDNNGKRTSTVKVYDKEGNLVKENSVTGTGVKGSIVTVDGLDASVTGYKVEFTTNNKNCWIQAVKLEGTAKDRYIPNFYLEQEANVIKAVGLAEGEALRYKKFINEDIPSGTSIDGNDEEFPAKGLSFTPGDVLKLRIRAYDKNNNASATWTHTYELPVPVITEDTVTIVSVAKLDIDEETGQWKTSIKYNEWNKAYNNLNKVQWTTTSTDYQYIYKVVPGHEKVVTLGGDTIEVPVVAMNRKNTMYFITEAPSFIKVTSAPIYKSPGNEPTEENPNGSVTIGKNFELDGVRYVVGDDGTLVLNVEAGVHTFTMTNKPELGFQMLEIIKSAPTLAGVVAKEASVNTADAEVLVMLDETDYVCNTPVIIPAGKTVMVIGAGNELVLEEGANFQSNGSLYLANVKIDAAKLGNNALIQMGSNPVKTVLEPATTDEEGKEVAAKVANGQIVDAVLISNCEINNLPSYIYSDGGKAWIINEFAIDNSVIKLNTTDPAMKGQALIRANGYGIVSNMINESTIYNVGEADAAAKYLIQYNNSARADRMNAEMAYVILRNNTMYNTWSAGGQIANYSGIGGKNTTTFTMQNNIFVGMTDVARRFVGGNNGSAIVTFENNTYMKADGTFDNASNYDKSGTAIEMDPQFKNAAAGDFTVHASSKQAELETGDPRWLVEYNNIPAVVATEGAKYFWASNEVGYVTEVGGKAVANETAAGRVNYTNAGYYTISLNGAKDFSTSIVTVTLNKALEAGDVIRITGYQNKDAEGKKTGAKFRFNGDDNNILATADDVFNNIHPDFATGDGKPNTVDVTVTDAQVDCKSFEMTRVNTGTNLFITVLEVLPKDVATGISNATVAPVANGAIFNLAGQKVNNSYKGIVIMNGKKVLVK